MPTLTINENQFRHITDDAKVRCRYSFVPGSVKQTPYVLIEWDNRANHIHAELEKLTNGKYYRLGSTPTSPYEFAMSGFHIKLKDSDYVHDYMGFRLDKAGVWSVAWGKRQVETPANRFQQGGLGKEDEALLLRIGRSFIKDLGTVTNTAQGMSVDFEGK